MADILLTKKNKDILRQAEEIFTNFELYYKNNKGLYSRNCPPTERLLFDNFDDIAPFFVYFGKDDLLLRQIEILQNIDFNTILSLNGVIYSYKIDEFVGGVHALWKSTGNLDVKIFLDKIVSKIEDYFFNNNNIFGSYDLKKSKNDSFYYFWSAGLLETFIEMRDDYPKLFDKTVLIINHWLENDYFKKNGLFPFRDSDNYFFKLISKTFSFFNVYKKNYPGSSTSFKIIKQLIFKYFSSGYIVQLMKSNTTFVFTLIEIFRVTSDEKYKKNILFWVDNAIDKLCKDGVVYGKYYGKASNANLTNSFIMIDVLMDVYYYVENNQKYLDIAKEIIDRSLKSRWNNGLIPFNEDGDFNHIDNQVDFSIAIRRYSELSGNKKYFNISSDIIKSVLKHHKTKKGYCTRIDSHGKKINKNKINFVDPKYNGLLLKGLINLLTMKESIYQDKKLHNLFKDR